MKNRLFKIPVTLLGLSLFLIIALASMEDDPFDKGNSLLKENKYKEAIASYEKIESTHAQFANKNSLITKAKEDAKKYYTEQINLEINNLNEVKATDYLNLCKEITGVEIMNKDDISKKIAPKISIVKNNIKTSESKKDYYGIVKEAEKLLNIPAEKTYAEGLISKYQELAKKEEIAQLKKEVSKLISVKKYDEAKGILNKLSSKYSEEYEYVSKMKAEITDLINNPRFNIGEKFQTDELEITINSVKSFTSIGDPDWGGTKASQGGILVGVVYSIKNITKEPLGVFDTAISLNLVNSDGTKLDEDDEATFSYQVEIGTDEKFFDNLNPGITVKNASVFEIEKQMWNTPGWHVLVEGKKIIVK